jgi:DoxX-like protein
MIVLHVPKIEFNLRMIKKRVDILFLGIKIIAALELVSGLMVIVLRLLWHGRYFTFMGAASIALIMIGSIFTHIRRKEFQHAIINLVFLLMALFVAYAV